MCCIYIFIYVIIGLRYPIISSCCVTSGRYVYWNITLYFRKPCATLIGWCSCGILRWGCKMKWLLRILSPHYIIP
jgi:hypothetical protein